LQRGHAEFGNTMNILAGRDAFRAAVSGGLQPEQAFIGSYTDRCARVYFEENRRSKSTNYELGEGNLQYTNSKALMTNVTHGMILGTFIRFVLYVKTYFTKDNTQPTEVVDELQTSAFNHDLNKGHVKSDHQPQPQPQPQTKLPHEHL